MDPFRGPEKRQSRRLDVTYQISYKVKNSTAPFNMSRTKNISRGGMRLTVNKLYFRGTPVSCVIRGPFSMEGVEVEGEILESRELVKGSLYEVRIRFSPLSHARLAGLDDFIKRRLR